MFRLVCFLITACSCFIVNAQSIRVDALPLYNKTQLHSKTDWLISNAGNLLYIKHPKDTWR